MSKFFKMIAVLSFVFLLAGCATTNERTVTRNGIELMEINSAGDSFTMGDGSTGLNAVQTFAYNYRMSKYETTHAQFRQFYEDGGYNRSTYWTTNGWAQKMSGGIDWTRPFNWTVEGLSGDHQPVGSVSWYEAVAFCNWLSDMEGLKRAYDATGRAELDANGYRLPTEAEWEYAAAKGSKGQAERIYPFGNAWDMDKVVGNTSSTADVGSRSKAGGDTPQGLVDMGGNVNEWCSDSWREDGLVAGGLDSYFFEDDSPERRFILRGGAYPDPREDFFRCAGRAWNPATDRGTPRGFRVVRRSSNACPAGSPTDTRSTG